VTSRLPILSTVTTAYSDVGRALSTMYTLAISVFFILLAISVVEDQVPMRVWAGAALGGALGFAVDVVKNFCVTPFMMAIHRFILRGEVTRGYAPDPGQPGFMAFFGWLVALSAITALAFLLQDVLTATGLSPVAGIAVVVVAIIAVGILTLRLSILFPAIAIEARGANAANAMADTKGHVFTICLIFLLALLPLMAVAIGVTLMLGRGVAVPGTSVAIIHLAVGAAVQTLTLSLGVAIASRVFQVLANRVLRAG
jgi:hypothetical protein